MDTSTKPKTASRPRTTRKPANATTGAVADQVDQPATKAKVPPRAKRARADSASSAVKAMVDAAKPDIEVPAWVALTESAKPFWVGVVRARARDEWQDVDLVVAAQLAQCQADIAEEDAALRLEGKVIKNDRGTPVMNPRTTVLEQLARREMALMRTLRMGGRIAGDQRDDLGKRKLEVDARKARKQVEEEDDGLLA
ncbi:TerS protein [Massilia sp. YIM B02763]|uniref:TerS protein n=1 Tax=Massilia sp. YIM B02763 TaxID=3050130 RepID=UPI0025B6BA2B|nr:TerS protein [Massilia sp. YIM B02763]MDN4052893.1 TerS protein [Massilia sp. YIM B02763]